MKLSAGILLSLFVLASASFSGPTTAFAETAKGQVPTSTAQGQASLPTAGTGARATVETIIGKARTLDNKATHAQSAAEIESLVDFQKITDNALGSYRSSAS